MAFLGPGEPQVVADPSLTQPARLPAEIGRLEFKAFDAIGDFALYGELLSLLTGLVLDTTLPGRRTTPDAAAHRHAATVGLADDADARGHRQRCSTLPSRRCTTGRPTSPGSRRCGSGGHGGNVPPWPCSPRTRRADRWPG